MTELDKLSVLYADSVEHPGSLTLDFADAIYNLWPQIEAVLGISRKFAHCISPRYDRDKGLNPYVGCGACNGCFLEEYFEALNAAIKEAIRE